MFTNLPTTFAALRRDACGSVTMMFALSLLVLILALGLAVDIARAFHTKTKLANALDSAALAAAKSLHDTQMGSAEITALARRYFEINLGPDEQPSFGSISDFTVSIDKPASLVSVSATANVPTVFARIGGIEKIKLPTTAVAAFNPQDIEVSLSLDLTGSMCNPCTKIDDLKVAASDMIDILLPATKGNSNKVRVALAPFAAGVNAGSYARAAAGRRGPDNCAFERDGAEAATDAAPGAGGYLKVAGDAGVANARNNCPNSATVTPLSDNPDTLKGTIGRLATGGSTAGHLGTAWAWYLVSPNWAPVWPSESQPAEYRDGKTVKAVVLMTDGVFNTFGGACDRGCSSASAQAAASQDAARRMCKNMKDQSIKVYTVGFKLDDPLAEGVLKECASSLLTFYRAENGEALRDAFRNIADDLMRLRLSK